MRRFIVIAALLCAACVPKQTELMNTKGLNAFESGNLNRAEEIYSEAIDEYDHYTTRELRGDLYMERGEYAAAENDYTAAMRYQVNMARLYYKRGMARLHQGAYDFALLDLDEAVSRKPSTWAEAYAGMAEAYRAQGNTKEALFNYTKAITYDPELTMAYIGRGRTYLKAGDLERAVVDATKGIELAPESADGYLLRSDILRSAGKESYSLRDLEKAVELEPKNAAARHKLAWRLATAKDPAIRNGSLAVENAAEALRLRPSNRGVITLAVALAEADRFEDALEILEQRIEAEKDLVEKDGLRVWKKLFEKGEKYRGTE
ncbi:tetratricopeptide repeat protein [Limisalsivibrio acetivorans]|uniref:tetratricopeptide repeat protein n=1 Tax=Limisalsivibrio acetivorans TaxID=1304888 RepID=UPI0003B68596|nr:tetratricopeptide repeat protein [Limisalsivibrio acetivorans]